MSDPIEPRLSPRGSGALAPLARAETIEPHSPTLRDRARVGLASLLGPELAGRVAGSREDIGLLDMTPAGVPFALQEGTRAAARGARAGDPAAAALGAGEALLAITPLPGPALRGAARTMAPAGGGRGGGRDTDYRFERVWDPERGREVTRITPRVSGSQEGTTQRQLAQERGQRAAPAAGGEQVAPTPGEASPRPRFVRDPATGAQVDMMGAGPDPAAARTPTFSERLAATDQALPTEFPRVRLPAGSSADPAHEWVQVPATALERIGLRPQQLTDPLTRMSPDGGTAYLGPADVSRFLTAWDAPSRQMLDPLPAPTLLPPRALPDAAVLGFPRAAVPGPSLADVRREAQGATQRATTPPRTRWFGDDAP